MAVVNFGLERPTEMTVVDPKELLEDDPPPKVDPETGIPTSVHVYVVSQDPEMKVVPHCFSDVECDHLLGLVKGHWVPSLVGSSASAVPGKSGSIKNNLSKNRTSWSCQTRYAQTAILERLEHRLASVAGVPVSQLERFNMVRYSPGELFNEHHDGKFRPRTVFVYLNDLPEEDGEGDTFFPFLGVSFKPRKGTAVIWSNALPCGKEDSRMMHAGRAPRIGVKYGANCFFNDQELRAFVPIDDVGFPLEKATLVDLRDHCKDDTATDSVARDEKEITVCNLSEDPQICAVTSLLSDEEVASILATAKYDEHSPPPLGEGPYARGDQTLHMFEAGETQSIQHAELRLCAMSGLTLPHLTKCRLIRPGKEQGFCDRGSGTNSVYICMSERDEIFFPNLGWKLVLRRGDALSWANICFGSKVSKEELRTMRVHVGEAPALGLAAAFLDNPIREQQLQREFLDDSLFPAV
eukprot:TRINITY_DN22160_c0_g1_i1.p1 TRINITY_DN22160_c0_g1~~TRINITY_DN22160_c0_g1_i1.p1  ORF type:complete len:466 (+),score=76.24 TRINITY_DN22160_c0_g1_i1:126-1523(+)